MRAMKKRGSSFSKKKQLQQSRLSRARIVVMFPRGDRIAKIGEVPVEIISNKEDKGEVLRSGYKSQCVEQ
jgi:hypothetical protein